MRLVPLLAVAPALLLAACGDSVVLSDADGWLELKYDCERIAPAAYSSAQQSVVREYANRIVFAAARESRLDSVDAVVQGYDGPSPALLEEAVVYHLCHGGRLASVAALDSARNPPPRAPGRGSPPTSPASDSARRANLGVLLRPGAPAPTFIAPWLDSAYLAERPDHLRLNDLRGRWVLLNFWATWCGPCLRKHPEMVEISERYADRDLVVLGVLHRDWPDEALDWLSTRPVGRYRTIVDEDLRISNLYGIYGIPRVYLIDPAGNVADNAYYFDSTAFLRRLDESENAGTESP